MFITRKKIILTSLLLVLLLVLSACGSSDTASTANRQQTTAAPVQGNTTEQTEAQHDDQSAALDTTQAPADSTQATTPTGKETLVIFFSATGTTKAVAEKIAAITEAELYEIKAAQEYSDADLNWHDSGSRTTIEQNDKSTRPEIGSEPISLTGYKTIYIGYPIWWGEEPRILDTFVEACDFDGITMIPFCTSSSSGIGRSGKNLAENAGSGTWLDGKRFGAGVSESELQSWIESLN